MKNFYLAFYMLFFGFGLQAQSDWQLFRPGVQYLYDYTNATFIESPVLGIKTGTDTCTEMYPSLRWYDEFECNEIASSFMGYEVCQTPTETRLLIREGEYVTIRQAAALNEKWPAYTEGNDTVWARVSFIQSMNFLGLTDSVKSIHFYRQGGGGPNYLPAENSPVQVSKQYGLIRTFGFRDFPAFSPQFAAPMPIVGLSVPKVGLQNPDRASIFNFQAGDEIHIKATTLSPWYVQGEYLGNNFERKFLKALITEVEQLPGDQLIRFHYTGQELKTKRWGTPPVLYEVFPEETVSGIWEYDLSELEYLDLQPGAVVTVPAFIWEEGIAIVSLTQSGFCEKAGKYLSNPLEGSNGCYQPLIDGIVGSSYYENLAGEYYNYSTFSGHFIREVVYFNSDSLECGSPIDFDQITTAAEVSKAPVITLGPNPTAGLLQIQLPQGLVADLKLYDPHGRLLLSENQAQGTVDWNLNALPAGAYQISASQDGKMIWRQRVLKL
ncbi:MAG: T9SS type A sorting domain-containing protein [Saprospiraceae bacterium]